MPLEIYQVRPLGVVRPLEEVIETDLVERGRGGEGGDVAADGRVFLVGVDDHRHRVPADQALDAPFQLAVAGEQRLSREGDGVDVGRVGGERDFDAAANGLVFELTEQELRPFFAAGLHDRVEGVEPFRGFDGIDIANAFMGVGLDMPVAAVGERPAFAVARAADGFHIAAAPLGAVCHY